MADKSQPVLDYDTATIWSMGVTIPVIQIELQKIFEKRGPLNVRERTLISELIHIWLPAFDDFIISECNRRKAPNDLDNSDNSDMSKSQCDSMEE